MGGRCDAHSPLACDTCVAGSSAVQQYIVSDDNGITVSPISDEWITVGGYICPLGAGRECLEHCVFGLVCV